MRKAQMLLWMVLTPAIARAQPAPVMADSDEARELVPDRYVQQYFGNRPSEFLIDPQRILHPRDYKDRNHFLNYHSSDSAIDLWFYIFGQNQDVPEEGNLEDLSERFFSTGRPAALVFYFQGDPERSQLALSPSLDSVVSESVRDGALESAAEQASKDASTVRQLERYMVQMSVSVYRMESLLEEDANDSATVESHALPEQEVEVLADQTDPLIRWLEQIQQWMWQAIAGVIGLVLVVLVRVVSKKRKTYRFIAVDVEPRLGGEHGAGVGAVISFANASLPPAVQRDQAPEHLS